MTGMERNKESLEMIYSTLVRADLSELDKQMNANSKLKELMTTEGKDLPNDYSYLLGEVVDNWETFTLHDFVRLTINNHRPGTEIHCYFSMSGDDIVGFAAYEVDSSKRYRNYTFVSEIKMFSFDLSRPNPVLIRDLKMLLDKLINEYKEVTWIAVADNPANKIYRQAITDYKGKVIPLENGRLYEYSITGKGE